MKNKSNIWKKAFFTLFILNLGIVIFLSYLIILPFQKHDIVQQEEIILPAGKLNFFTSKEDINNLINYYLQENKDQGYMNYQVKLDNNTVDLYANIQVFEQSVEVKLSFVPVATASGDIILQQESIQIGKLELPIEYVMTFIARAYDFPDWVEIYPNEHLIYVHLTDMELKNGTKIIANHLDLENDDISFTILFE